jgi:hypothetical protein
MGLIREIVHKILQITHGRTTWFFLMFFISGTVLQFEAKLTETYVHFMVGLGALVVGHSLKDDLALKWNGPRPNGGPDGANQPAA